MKWLLVTLGSSLGRKLFMSLTGLFLCSFLVVHLIGNLQLLISDPAQAQSSFNAYAHFMTSTSIVKVLSYGLYAGFLFHIIDGIILMLKNRASRPVPYKKFNVSTKSPSSSKMMGLLGILVLVFLVIHMKSFWFEMHFGEVGKDANGNKDLYTVCDLAFNELWYVILYVVSMFGLSFHLLHGFSSAFQTLGLNHPKYTPTIKFLGTVFAVVVPALFAVIPVVMYLS